MTWFAATRGKRGRSPKFSDAAIEFCLTLKNLFGLALRQATGLVESVLQLSGLTWPTPDFSTPSSCSIGNRAKEDLVVDFINHTNLDDLGDKATVIDAFFQYAQAEHQREAQALIDEEKLNAEAAKRYITNSLKREFASDSGTELNAVLPKMSPLNPQYLTKKQTVFQKIAAFVEKFKGVGGQV